MLHNFKILLIEDNEGDERLLRESFSDVKNARFELVHVDRLGSVTDALAKQSFDVILLDLGLPDSQGMNSLKRIQKAAPDLPVVVITGRDDDELSTQALQAGAQDYIVKQQFEPSTLLRIIRYAIERKHTQQALSESKARYRTLVEHASEGIAVLDRKTLRFVDANENAARMIGVTKDEFLQLSWVDISKPVQPDGRPAIEAGTAFMEDTLAGKAPVFEWTCVKPTGEEVITEMRLVKLPKTGADLVRVSMTDIENRKRAEWEKEKLEKQLRHAQKMKALGTLAGGIAHDFNNMLGAIIGYAELCFDDIPPESVAQENLEEILRAGYRARDLVKQILAFSRQDESEHREVKVGLIVREAVRLLTATVPKSIELKLNVDTDSDVVLGDPSQLHQVIMNLCTNAVHAMRQEGGLLEVRVENNCEMEPALSHKHLEINSDECLKISVRDTGHGIPPEIVDRIFEPFFTTKEAGEGTGLGLSVVHGIIQSHSGHISVESNPGKGTKFEIFLPKLKKQAKPKIGEVQADIKGDECILCIDDERAILNVMKKVLTNFGYEVITKTSGIKALNEFRRNPNKFDLVITDQAMPLMTGATLAGELIHIRPDIPIILCTGFSEEVSEEQAKSLGIKEYIMKPILSHELAETVRRTLDKPTDLVEQTNSKDGRDGAYPGH